MQYRGANTRIMKTPDIRHVEALLESLRAQGANAWAIDVFDFCYVEGASLAQPPKTWYPNWYIYPDLGQDTGHPWGDTTDVERIYAYAKMALDMGFERVLLKPMIDSRYAAWRGFISVQGHKRQWASAYKTRFLTPLLPIVKELGLDLCIGTEMYTVTKELGAAFWMDIVHWLRYKGVKQRLTYAANWGWELDAEYNRLKDLWGVLDYVGVDAYWPMCNADYTGPITKELLLNGAAQNIGWSRKLAGADGVPLSWCPRIDDDIAALAVSTGKPIVFSEIGYPATLNAAIDPAGDMPDSGRTTEVSDVLWEAAREKWDGVLEGWYAWEASNGSAGVPNGTHNILGTPSGDSAWGGQV